jgi:hypothetical protein
LVSCQHNFNFYFKLTLYIILEHDVCYDISELNVQLIYH